MSGLEFHPLADLFPMLDDEEQGALAADIRDHGLHAPIATYEGKILDGRNRYRACQVAGVNPAFKEYKGDDPLGYVVSLNMVRRHLDGSQRAMIAAKIETLKHGGNRQDANLHLAVSRDEAARMLNVSPRSVASAAQVLDSGDPDMIAKVEHGDLAVSAAAATVRESKPAEAFKTYKHSKTANKYIAAQEAELGPVEGSDAPVEGYAGESEGGAKLAFRPITVGTIDHEVHDMTAAHVTVTQPPIVSHHPILKYAPGSFGGIPRIYATESELDKAYKDFAKIKRQSGTDEDGSKASQSFYKVRRPADDQTIEWLEEHVLASALREARDGGNLGVFFDFLSNARGRLADDTAFVEWLAEHKIELVTDVTIKERAMLTMFRAR
jgi:hypothetical protein